MMSLFEDVMEIEEISNQLEAYRRRTTHASRTRAIPTPRD
jgi:hypothetical protein